VGAQSIPRLILVELPMGDHRCRDVSSLNSDLGRATKPENRSRQLNGVVRLCLPG